MLRGSRRRRQTLQIIRMLECTLQLRITGNSSPFVRRCDVSLAFFWAMKRATRLCRKARREMGWHVVTRHHGPEPLFENLFCIRTHPFRPLCLSTQPLGSEEASTSHSASNFLLFPIQLHSLLLHPTSE
jgi:hypothetical protein